MKVEIKTESVKNIKSCTSEKLNANDTCVEAPLRQAVGTTSVLAAVRTIGGIYMFGRVMPVWSVVLVQWLRLMCFNFPFAFFTQLFFIQPFVRTVFKLIFARAENRSQ